MITDLGDGLPILTTENGKTGGMEVNLDGGSSKMSGNEKEPFQRGGLDRQNDCGICGKIFAKIGNQILCSMVVTTALLIAQSITAV